MAPPTIRRAGETGAPSASRWGLSHYDGSDPGAAATLGSVIGAEDAPSSRSTDSLHGIVDVSARPPSIHLPTEFEIRDTSEGEHTEITVEQGKRVLGKLNGGSDALVYTSPEGAVEALAERIPSRMGRGKDFLVRDPDGRIIGTLRGAWNNRYTVRDQHGNEVAQVMPKSGRNNYVVRSQGRDIALISHPSGRGVGGQWRVSQETSHKVDPRLLVVLPAVTLFKNREVNDRMDHPSDENLAEAAPQQDVQNAQGDQAQSQL